MVGHNPDLSYFAEYVSSSELGSMPTAGLAVIQFNNIKWTQVTKSSGDLLNFISPDLLD
jgi:phosphohistidine phosphatase